MVSAPATPSPVVMVGVPGTNRPPPKPVATERSRRAHVRRTQVRVPSTARASGRQALQKWAARSDCDSKGKKNVPVGAGIQPHAARHGMPRAWGGVRARHGMPRARHGMRARRGMPRGASRHAAGGRGAACRGRAHVTVEQTCGTAAAPRQPCCPERPRRPHCR
eukprot:2419778-Prymnesium_polylepis.1